MTFQPNLIFKPVDSTITLGRALDNTMSEGRIPRPSMPLELRHMTSVTADGRKPFLERVLAVLA